MLPFRAWVFLAVLVGFALRLAYVWGSLLVHCPADRGRIWVFLLVSVILAWAPGLFLRRWLRVRTENPFLDLAFILTAGLTGSAFVVWVCYSLGFYTRPVLVVILALLAAGGVYGVRDLRGPVALWPARLKRAVNLPWGEGLALIGGAWLVLGLFERVVGTPMVSWDALVSWDKWAVDASLRTGLGRYAMGGYPQFLPMLGSVFYKLAGSGPDVFPIEHLLLQGFYVHFVLLLVLALLALGRELAFPGGLVLALFLGNKLIFEMVVDMLGSVDIPFTAVWCAACALIYAHLRGTWRSSGTRERTAVALFLPLLAVPFMKGNGLPWLGILLVAAGLALRDWRRWRPLAAAGLAATGLSVVYLLHQAWYGAIRMGLSEQDPFLRSHVFRAAHTKQFVVSLAHLETWSDRLGAACGLAFSGGGALLVAASLGLCLWAVRKRELAFFAITGPLALAVWFYTGSYDFRNAATAWAMICIAAAGILWSGRAASGRRAGLVVRRGVLLTAAAGAGIHLFILSRLPLPVGHTAVFMNRPDAPVSLFKLPLREFQVPKIARLPRDQRHMGVRPWGDLREILFKAPFGRRATHLLAADGLYRVLAPKGVFMMQKTRHNGQRRFDLALGEPYMKPPEDYEKVSRFRRVGLYNVPVRLFRPEFEEVVMQTAGSPPDDVRHITFKAGETYTLQFAESAGTPVRLKEGILSLVLSSKEAQASLALSADAARRDPYAAYFESVRQDASLRLLYWMNDDRPELPQFVLQVGSNDLRVVAAEWGQ